MKPVYLNAPPAVYNKKEALDLLGGDEAIFKEVVALFLEQMPLRLRELNEARERSDYAALVMLAHTLKSSAATVGAAALRSLFTTLENACGEKNAETLRSLIAQLSNEFSRYREAVS